MTLDGDGPSELVNAGLHHKVAAGVGQVSVLRGLLTNWAIDQQIADEMVDDMRLAAEEAMTNVVMHAYPAGTTGTMTLLTGTTVRLAWPWIPPSTRGDTPSVTAELAD